jgi:hypothetical protein
LSSATNLASSTTARPKTEAQSVSKPLTRVALLLKLKQLLIGRKTPTATLFVYAANGKKLTEVTDKNFEQRWALMSFNSDEDIVLLSSDGLLLIVDPVTGITQTNQLAGFSDKVT